VVKVKNILRELFLKRGAISYKYLIVFFLSSISLTAQNFQLASNNKTITCDSATVGSTDVVNGKTYTKVDETQLRSSVRHKLGLERSQSLTNAILLI